MGARPLPARYPPNGSWPAVMRADTAAAFFDLQDTAALHRAIARGEVPRPSDTRLQGRSREPLWALEVCRNFVVRRHEIGPDATNDNLADLV